MRWLASLVVLLPLAARAYDPALPWFTLETPNFRVHFHDGPKQHALAQRVGRTCEAAHRVLVPLLGWAPERKTEVVLLDDGDFANGMASAYLRPSIVLWADVPEDLSTLNDYHDYLWDLIVHEYVHVLHLDDARGAPALVNRVFGKLLTPNAYAPRWLVEGLATYQESNVSAGGRNRSSLYDMWLRGTFVEGAPFRLDETSHYPSRWPWGNLAYLYGGRFLRYVAERVGEERLARYFAHYGARVVPFALNVTAQEQLGVDWVTLYRDWQEALGARYRAQLEAISAAGETPFRRLTETGEGTGQPRFSRDGRRVFYLESGPERRAAIRSVGVNGEAPRLELLLEGPVDFDLSPDERRVVFSASETYREHSSFQDLWEAELCGGRSRRLTHGLRASEPSYSPDGQRIAFVGRGGSGSSYLGLMDLRTGDTARLLEAGPDERVFTPTFSPTGQELFFTQQSGSARQLRALDLTQRQVRTVAAGHWMHLRPHVTAGGRILVTADRTGVYNLHEVDPKTGELTQVTNVTLGAFEPVASPDGQWVAFTAYSPRGYDVALMRSDDRFAGPALPPRPARPEPVYRDDPRVTWPVRRYSPLDSLLPQYWLPISSLDPRGTTLGVVTSGGDLSGRHSYGVAARYGLDSGEPAASIGYSANVAYPSLGFSLSTDIAQAPGFARGLYDRVWSASAGASFSHRTREGSAAASIGYEWVLFQPRYQARFHPDGPPPRLPRAGTVGALSLSTSFSNARRYASSISAEEGHAFSFRLRRSGRETLGSFEYASADARYQTYLALPWARRHVAALRVSAGAAVGDLGGRAVYGLGGISLHDPILQLIRGEGYGAGHLRGYPPGAFAGNSYALANLEYRFPLVEVDRGLSSLPLFLRKVHGTVFADAGAVGGGQLELGPPKVSVGVELRSEVYLGYYLGTELRLGYARGLASGGVNDLYLTVGSSF